MCKTLGLGECYLNLDCFPPSPLPPNSKPNGDNIDVHSLAIDQSFEKGCRGFLKVREHVIVFKY